MNAEARSATMQSLIIITQQEPTKFLFENYKPISHLQRNLQHLTCTNNKQDCLLEKMQLFIKQHTTSYIEHLHACLSGNNMCHSIGVLQRTKKKYITSGMRTKCIDSFLVSIHTTQIHTSKTPCTHALSTMHYPMK